MEKAPTKIYNNKTNDRQQRTQWYRDDTKNVHDALFAAVETIDKTHNQRRIENAKYITLYENLEMNLPGLRLAGLSTFDTTRDFFGRRLTYNVIRSVIDTAASKIAASKPRPEFNSDNNDFRDEKEAKALTRLNDAIFYANQTYSLMQDCFIDAAVRSTGVIQGYRSGDQIKHERISIDEILVDNYDGFYRKPQSYYHVRPVFRDSMLFRAEEENWSKPAIEAIKTAPQAENTGTNSTSDMILVIEAWHLARRTRDKKLRGGRHAVCLANFTLLSEEYKSTKPPFVFFRWAPKLIGFYGTGLAEQLVPIQREIADTLRHIARHNRHTGLKLAIEPGSLLNIAQLAQTDVPVLEVDGEIKELLFPGVSQETYAYLADLYQKAFEISGISQSQAFASKPASITAAAAIDTLNDQQTERFMLISQRFEQFACDIAELSLRLASDMALDEEDPVLPFGDKDLSRDIDFKSLDLDSNQLKIKCFPVSAFTQTPAARMQQIAEYAQQNLIQPNRAMQLMGENPDLRDEISLQTASLSRVQHYLDLMKHEGKYNAPDDKMTLPEAIQVATAEINRSIVQNVPELRINLMRDFIDDCLALQPAPPPPPAQLSA